MVDLIHLVYCSAAQHPVSRSELAELLAQARRHNAACGITGILLYSQGTFFQVLEGPPADVDRLYQHICRDPRHSRQIRIIREPIAGRAFGDWTMGYADMPPGGAAELEGLNDFLQRGANTVELGAGRAFKLLEAFRQGRWRAALSDRSPALPTAGADPVEAFPGYSFAYQPIVQTAPWSVFAYEALLRGPRGEPAATILKRIDPLTSPAFYEQSRVAALKMAARLKLTARLNLNFPPSQVRLSPTAVSSALAAAQDCGIAPKQITLEILESEIIDNPSELATIMNEYRATGLTFAIDDFGSGYAGLNLLADFQPDYVKLDMNLVRGVHGDGPRQAIVRGIVSTCRDLGIAIIAEGVECAEEFSWLWDEEIRLFQGFLFARPAFESLPTQFSIPG